MQDTKTKAAANKKDTGSNRTPFFQPKLTVNKPNDVYEREADVMADRVMRMVDSSPNENAFFKPVINNHVQRKCQHCEEEEKLHRKESSDADVQVSSELDSYVSTLGSSGQRLSENSKAFFEPRFGQDFSNVRIHNDSVAAKSAQSINALAYTTGNNIVFNQGQYAPDSDNGKKLMAHELTHVVQQKTNSDFINRSMVQRSPDFSGISCAFLLIAKESGRVKGNDAHNHIGKDFQLQVNSAVRIRIDSASFSHYRTEGNGDAAPSSINPVGFNPLSGSNSGDGIPDLVYFETSGFDQLFELAEIKIATFGGLVDAELQVGNYLEKANRGERVRGYNPQLKKYSEIKGNKKFVAMPTSRFTPKPFVIGNKKVAVTWCGPGVILYKVIDINSDENKKEQHQQIRVPKPEGKEEKVKPIRIVDALPDFYQYADSASKTTAPADNDFIIAIDSGIYKQVLDDAFKQRLKPMQIDPRSVPIIQITAPISPYAVAGIVITAAIIAAAIALLGPAALAFAGEAAAGAELIGAGGALAGSTGITGTTTTGVVLTLLRGGGSVAASTTTRTVLASIAKAAAVLAYLKLGAKPADAAELAKSVTDKPVIAILNVTNDKTLAGAQLGSVIDKGGHSFNSIAKLTTR